MVWILSELYFCLSFPKDNQVGLSRQSFLEERIVGGKHHLQHVQTNCCSRPGVTTGTTATSKSNYLTLPLTTVQAG